MKILPLIYERMNNMNSEQNNNSGTSAASFFEKGMLEKARGRMRRAIDFFKLSLTSEGYAAETFYNLGMAEAAARDFTAALNDFSKAADSGPGHFRSCLMKGIVHLAGNEYASAASVIRYGELRPEHMDIMNYSLTAAWLGAGNADEAGRIFRCIKNLGRAAEDFFEAWTDIFETPRTDCDLDGIVVNYHPGGTEKQIFTYDRGVLDGEYIESYANGKIKEHGFYKEGLREGVFTQFHQGGAKKLENLYQKGVLEGTCKEFDAGGEAAAEFDFLKGRRHGASRLFSPGGILREEQIWVNGGLAYSREYNGDGTLKEGDLKEETADKKFFYEKKYVHGELRGQLKMFIIENGRRALILEEFYKLGRREGKCRYYLNGKLREERNYANGSLNGISTIFYESGKKYIEKNYSENLMEGPESYYTEDGEPYMEYNYINGLKDGLARIYAQKPNSKKYYILEEKHYKAGLAEGICKIYNKNGILSEQWQYRHNRIFGRGLRFHENGKISHEGYFIGSPDNSDKYDSAGLELFYDGSGAITKISYINSINFI